MWKKFKNFMAFIGGLAVAAVLLLLGRSSADRRGGDSAETIIDEGRRAASEGAGELIISDGKLQRAEQKLEKAEQKLEKAEQKSAELKKELQAQEQRFELLSTSWKGQKREAGWGKVKAFCIGIVIGGAAGVVGGYYLAR